MNGEIYKRYAQGRARKSPLLRDSICAFFIGGTICMSAEILSGMYQSFGMTEEKAGTVTSVTLIFAAALLTGLGYFDKIAKFAGGGTLVPITGFANGIAAAAIDNKTEGYVLGVGAKIFTIAGPVIVYGVSASVVYGLIYWICQMI